MILKISGWSIIVLLILFGMDTPSYYDYGFFIGPALKLNQGEKLGSFYMQYGVGMTYFVKLMMDLGLRIYQMQVAFALVTIGWFVMYFQLAKKLIRQPADQKLVFLFMAALISFRYLAIYFDPVHTPATLPPRLDLWVPLALLILKFGFSSPVTTAGFTLAYMLDNTFGFFAFLVYALFLRKNLIISGLIMGAGVVFNLYFFKSLINPAVSLYQGINLGFLPISPYSLFWPMLAGLPYCINLLKKEKDQKLKKVYFFCFCILLLQLAYFYGRSHEANLLNISGIFWLILFISLSKLKSKKIAYVLASVLIIFSGIFSSKYIVSRALRVYQNLSQLRIVGIHPFDETIEKNKNMLSIYPDKKVIILSQFDAYLNYRMGLKQVGDIVPFTMHLYVDETSKFLRDQMNQGYKVVLWESEMIALANQLKVFKLIDKNGFYELSI